MDEKTINAISELISNNKTVFIAFFILCSIYIMRNSLGELIKKISTLNFRSKKLSIECKTQENNENIVESDNEALISDGIENKEENLDFNENKMLTNTLTKDDNKSDFIKLFDEAFKNRDMKEMEINFNKIVGEEVNAIEKNRLQCWYYYLLYSIGNADSIKQLEEIVENGKKNKNYEILTTAYYRLGMCYKEGNNLDKAINYFEKVIELDENAKYSYQYLGECLLDLGKSEKEATEKLLKKINKIEIVSENKIEDYYVYYEILEELYKRSGNNEKRAFSLLKALENKPNDTNLLFKTAVAFSSLDSKFNNVVLLFYKHLLSIKSDNASALNNLGVVYHNLSLPIHSINAYKNSIKNGETLPCSNLANKYIESGFFDEAENVLNEAIKQNNPHKSVGDAYSYIKSKKEEEEKKESSIINKSKKIREFFSRYSNSLFNLDSDTKSYLGLWNNNHDVKIENTIMAPVF